MVGVAQLVERRLVVADVAGSSPVTHPHERGPRPHGTGAFLVPVVCLTSRELALECFNSSG